jgi:hypothetical protein
VRWCMPPFRCMHALVYVVASADVLHHRHHNVSGKTCS